MKKDTQRHLTKGVSQYEYLQEVEDLMDGQAARLLEEFIDAWDPNNKEGQYYEEALRRESIREWRQVVCLLPPMLHRPRVFLV